MWDFELPKEMLAALPSDPYEQLDVARKITSLAVGARVSELEAEARTLQWELDEKDITIHSLEDHVAALEQSLQDTSTRLSHALEVQAKLTTEKNALSMSIKKLTRDVAKLETFKRTLMKSLEEEEEEDKINMPNHDDEKPLGFSLDSTVSADSDSSTRIKSTNSGTGSTTVSPLHADEYFANEELSEKQSSTGSPSQNSASDSPRWHSTSDITRSLPSSESTSRNSTVSSSPPQTAIPGDMPRIDGKQFFRQARIQLSYGQFNAFLSIIKELNAHRETKEETLRKADEIFGPDNKDLFSTFQALLGRRGVI